MGVVKAGYARKFYRKGFWIKPYTTCQCANCGVKFSSSYLKFMKKCQSCGVEYLAYVEE